MKISLILIGKTDQNYLHEGIEIYYKRLKHYVPFDIQIIPDVKRKKITEDEQKENEGKLILQQLKPDDYVVLFDEKGQNFTSKQWADFFNKKMLSGLKRLVFVVGGPYGFSDSVYQRANHKTSLSSMTFSHQMVRLIIVEQIYRAFTILKGEPYHHE